MAANKFAFTEARALMKAYCMTLYAWANNEQIMTCPGPIREALLATIARMYEVVEGMPDTNGKAKLH